MENLPFLRLNKSMVSWVMGTKYEHTSSDGMLLSAVSYFIVLVLYFTLHYNSLKANNVLFTDYINNFISSYFSDYVLQSNEMSAYLNQLKQQTNKQTLIPINRKVPISDLIIGPTSN